MGLNSSPAKVSKYRNLCVGQSGWINSAWKALRCFFLELCFISGYAAKNHIIINPFQAVTYEIFLVEASTELCRYLTYHKYGICLSIKISPVPLVYSTLQPTHNISAVNNQLAGLFKYTKVSYLSITMLHHWLGAFFIHCTYKLTV